ncbi:MAG: MFS transporter [Lentisphaeria bacterium]|nr:MFS transporter [Lentisphaeria bacterium]
MLLENTRHWKRNVAMMSLSQVLVMAGFAAAIPFIPLYLKEHFGIVDEGERGLYMSMFYFFGMFAYGVFNPIWGSLSDRFGVKPMLLRGTFLTAVFFPMMAYVTQVWMLIALRFITAACAGTTAAAQTLLVKNTPEDKQGFALGMLTAAFWTGNMLGNVVGGLIVNYYGYEKTFWFCGILYFVAGIFVLFSKDDYIPAQASQGTQKAAKIHRYRHSLLPAFTIGVWLLMLLTVLFGFARSFEIPYIAMIVEQIIGPQKAAFWTGIISAFVSVGSMLSGVLLGVLADRIKPLPLLLPIMIITCACLFIQAASTNLWVFGISRTLMFFVFGGSSAIFMKLMSNTTPKRKRGAVFGYRSTAHNIGSMIASFFAGWVVFICKDVRSVFYAAALLMLALIPLTVWIIRRAMSQPFYIAHSPFGKHD